MTHLKTIMLNAWSVYRTKKLTFSDSLKLAWKKYYKLVKVTLVSSKNPLKIGVAVRVKNINGWDITKFFVFLDQIVTIDGNNYIDDYALCNIGSKLGYLQTVALR